MTACLPTPGVSPAWEAAVSRWGRELSRYPGRPAGLEMYSDAWADVCLDHIQEIRDADIINLHWVAGLVDYSSMATSLAGKKIVWTLHDMNPFTGGCHYAGRCNKYEKSCGACPQLGSTSEDDLAAKSVDLETTGISRSGHNRCRTEPLDRRVCVSERFVSGSQSVVCSIRCSGKGLSALSQRDDTVRPRYPDRDKSHPVRCRQPP